MIYQPGRAEGERVEFPERMALQELQMSLLAWLPPRDALEVIDVPAEEFGESILSPLCLLRKGSLR